ncbi:DUF1918 domain-containing protein [Georgenia satyanarayanai]|uniref:DUF1918 domain-containing protein n=1 Tax=Georgenia satyanarayanai TaxID=860221 RepID=UPI0012656D37|nr:DUF1918 domain-containing protein [Georgenia satyanarayanai]
MRAAPGDRLIIHAARLGGHDRDGEVISVRDPQGGPPYLVRWSDTGRESLLFPGRDTEIHHHRLSGRVPAGT